MRCLNLGGRAAGLVYLIATLGWITLHSTTATQILVTISTAVHLVDRIFPNVKVII